MKLSRLILLFMICAVFSVLFSCAPASETEQKQAIVISADASDTEVYAAQVLSHYLSALDGDEYPVISDDQSFAGFKFCIGATSAYDTSDMTDRAADSYNIAPFRNGLAIYGAGSRGTVYGVYTFLEDFCGYRCYTAESGIVSTSGKMILPEEKIEYNTFFEYRDTDWRSGWNPSYSVANKLNGESHRALSHEQGGYISYLGGSSHTLSTVFCSSDKYFESHPEYFALHDGERVPGQLCLTNESVYQIVLEEVLNLLKNGHDPEADLQIISLSQADNQDYCECDACKALDSANGSHAGTMITFVNRIARAVKEAGYDNLEFDTLAYMYTRKAPSAVAPEDNVIVRLCTFECCFSHPMDDAGCPENAELMRDLKEWSGISNKTYIWDYTTNYACTLGIFPDFHVLQKNLQCFYENGIRGVYEEGNYYIHLCDTEFGDLRTYLIAKLLEDPYCDYDAEMLEFCRYYYGGGGEYIKEAIDEITSNTQEHVSIYSSMTESFSIDEKEAEEIDQLWSMAENAAGKPEAVAAIKRSKLSWRYVKAALGLREFKGTLEENRDEREALYNDLISHGVEMIDEWTSIAPDFAEYEKIPVEAWEYAGRSDLLYDLYVAGEKADSQNADLLQDLDGIVLRDGGYIRYDDSLRTLYLKDVDIIPSEDPEKDGTAISYNARDNTALTIAVEGFCRLESRDCGRDSLMVLASCGNLRIDLQQDSVLEIEASPCRDKYTNIGIYMDSDRTLTVSGPGTLRVNGGDARSDDGGSIALYVQGEIIFEKDCSVNIVSDTTSAVSIGCRFEYGDFTFRDGSQIQIKGGDSGISYGMQLINDGIYNLYAENWTGSMTVSGSSGAVRYISGINASIRKDPEQIRLTGYTDMGEQQTTLLDEETYRYDALQEYTKLYFEGREKR